MICVLNIELWTVTTSVIIVMTYWWELCSNNSEFWIRIVIIIMNFEFWIVNYPWIYIYIILRQKSVKFNYFSNLLICRRSANSLNRRKLLICRTTPQPFDLHDITKVENQTKKSCKQISNDENKKKRTQIRYICKEKRKVRRQTSLSVSPLLPIRRTIRKKTPFLSHRSYFAVGDNLPWSRT